MRYLALLFLVACATIPYQSSYEGSGGLVYHNVPKTLMGASQELLGPGATSTTPTFTKVTSSTIQIPAGGSESGNGCVGYNTSDQICFNPNQMDITASGGINLNNQVNITGTSPILYANAATGKTQLTTNISAANTNNTTAPAVEIIPQNALDATDYILAVRKSDATDLFTVSQNGNTATPNGKTSAAGVDVSSSGLNFLVAGGYVSFNGTTQGGILTTSITAASAGATPGTAAHRIYSDNALDATDYVLSIGNAANAVSLVNVAYNGTLTQAASAGGSLAAGNISWTSGGAVSSGGGFSTVGSVAIAASTSGASFNLANKAAINTAPTISSGFGTSPSIVSSNGSLAFQINVGTGGVATTGVIGLPTATNGWVCTCEDVTTQSTTVARTRQTGLGTTTTCPIGDFTSADVAGAWVASDKLTCIAVAY